MSVDERATVDARLTVRGVGAGSVRASLAAGTRTLSLKVPAAKRRLLRRKPLVLAVTARDLRGNTRRVRRRL